MRAAHRGRSISDLPPRAMIQHYLDRLPLVAILRGVTPDEVVSIGEALTTAGFVIIEVPLNSPDPLESIRRLSERFGDDILIGAGTVTSARQVDDVARSGGRLVVMPHGDGAVVLRSMRAVRPATTPILPVGGISPDSMAAYVAAGAAGFGLGSALYRRGDDASRVGANARDFVDAWHRLRNVSTA
jgi:2-dehydro-3-deoxyphosphogalactonate aldolase